MSYFEDQYEVWQSNGYRGRLEDCDPYEPGNLPSDDLAAPRKVRTQKHNRQRHIKRQTSGRKAQRSLKPGRRGEAV